MNGDAPARFDDDALRQADLWDRWAEQFDELYGDRDPSKIVSFLRGQTRGSSALELGAGTGRVAVPLAAAGLSVTGIEISKGMVERFKEHAVTASTPNRLDIVQDDMAEFDLSPKTYDLVYIVRSTFFQLGSQTRQLRCFERVVEHLSSNGRVVLDCFIPTARLLSRDDAIIMTSYTESSVRLRSTRVEPVRQTIEYREIDIVNGSVPSVLPVEQRYCWPAELDLMARFAGLSLERRFADFSMAPIVASSPRHVSVYRRT